jgi:hypothetical protein
MVEGQGCPSIHQLEIGQMDFEIFVGWDPRDDLAANVCVFSLREKTPLVKAKFLREHELRRDGVYRREYMVKENGQMIDNGDFKPFSTQFSFTRFLTPNISECEYSVFVDADFLFRHDIRHMLEKIDPEKVVSVVKHNHVPTEEIKMDGMIQTRYHRKNWSSLMVFNNKKARECISVADVTEHTGAWLHGFKWVHDDDIGEIDPAWNWLNGYSDKLIEPAAVHFTLGTPDMIGNDIAYASEWNHYARQIL